MTNAARYLATGSVIALMAAFSFTAATAQDRNRGNSERPSMQDSRSGDGCVGVECMPNRMERPDRTGRPDADRSERRRDSDGQRNANRKDNDERRDVKRGDDDSKRVDRDRREVKRDWKYDSNRHKRSRNKDARYRYYYGGYWYLEPYWTLPVYGLGRVGCGEGRAIVNDNGFNRVRTIECSGRTFTYAARRHGDTFRVSLDSRTGEIVAVRPM